MKRALLLTDCSVDSALSLNRWLENQSDPLVDLTVIYAYQIPQDAGYPLNAISCREAKQEAIQKITRWADFLSRPYISQLKTETLLGTDQLVLAIYLLLRQYNYLLLNSWQEDASSAFVTCQAQIMTELHWLDRAEEVSASVDRLLLESLT